MALHVKGVALGSFHVIPGCRTDVRALHPLDARPARVLHPVRFVRVLEVSWPLLALCRWKGADPRWVAFGGDVHVSALDGGDDIAV